LIIIIYNYWEC